MKRVRRCGIGIHDWVKIAGRNAANHQKYRCRYCKVEGSRP